MSKIVFIIILDIRNLTILIEKNMKILKSKDLMLIFLLTSFYVIVISYPYNLNFNRSILEFVSFVLLFIFSGYSLISLLRPEENYIDILKKPVLLFEFSVLLIITVSLILKFTSIGLHLRTLTLVLSSITMFSTLAAYIRRIGYYKSMPLKKLDVSKSEPLVQNPNMGDNKAIRVNNVGMRFKLSKEKVDNLKEFFIKFLKRQISYKEFWAIKNITFDVEKGDRWGIIGLNGAGKSTLLKIISGVMKPTEGSVEIKGKLVPLLELGAGFDGNYTGKENIFLNGAMLGFLKNF